MTPNTVAEQIAARVNCYGIASWAGKLAKLLEVAPELLLPQRSAKRHIPELKGRGMELVFGYPEDDLAGPYDPERWALLEAQFFVKDRSPYGGWRHRLPLELEPLHETPASAQGKLGKDFAGGTSRDIAKGDTRITYFLPDARAVELQFAPGMQGLARVGFSRLGVPMPESYFVHR
jgi:hypothetical protein